MTGEDYLSKVLSNLYWKGEKISDWRELRNHLSKDDPEHEMLRAEIQYVNRRQSNYKKNQIESLMKESLSQDFNDSKQNK